jgi:hypothetical protein
VILSEGGIAPEPEARAEKLALVKTPFSGTMPPDVDFGCAGLVAYIHSKRFDGF